MPREKGKSLNDLIKAISRAGINLSDEGVDYMLKNFEAERADLSALEIELYEGIITGTFKKEEVDSALRILYKRDTLLNDPDSEADVDFTVSVDGKFVKASTTLFLTETEKVDEDKLADTRKLVGFSVDNCVDADSLKEVPVTERIISLVREEIKIAYSHLNSEQMVAYK